MLLYGFSSLLFKGREALLISDGYLMDHSRYESVGKIHFSEIKQVRKVGKYSLNIELKEPLFSSRKLNFLQKALHIATNWHFRNSIVISTAMLSCERDELAKAIASARRRYKQKDCLDVEGAKNDSENR